MSPVLCKLRSVSQQCPLNMSICRSGHSHLIHWDLDETTAVLSVIDFVTLLRPRFISNLCGEFTVHPFSLKRVRNEELWCILCCGPKQPIKQTAELLMIWDTIVLMWRHCVEIRRVEIKSYAQVQVRSDLSPVLSKTIIRDYIENDSSDTHRFIWWACTNRVLFVGGVRFNTQ